jgi:two-component system sensor histidine kinase SenX3
VDVGGHRKSTIAVFITLGAIAGALAIALNVSWIVITWRTGVELLLGVLIFPVIIAGMVLNTIFLVREVRRNEQHNSFINAVTHELKTPVASIRLYLETLRSRDVGEAKRQEFYQIMLEDSDRLLGTIEQVLRAGRTGQSKRHLNLTPVDLREMVRDCLNLTRIRYRLSEDSVDLIDALGTPERAQVMGDLDELKAAVLNLLDNAIKYSGDKVRVLVELIQSDPKHVAVRVRDEGMGIPTHELKRIFSRFYRVPGSALMQKRSIVGTGLGLSIVQSVARKHGGKVYAESDGPGRGSTFTLLLPNGRS